MTKHAFVSMNHREFLKIGEKSEKLAHLGCKGLICPTLDPLKYAHQTLTQ